MGKRNKSMKALGRFGRNNKVVLAALGGVAAGIAISRLFGTEKAAELLKTVERNITEFGSKVANGLHRQPSTDHFAN